MPMTGEVLACAAAAARACAFISQPDIPPRALEPPHPAFLPFRRMVYLWREPGALQPVGDSIAIWLAFLRERGVARSLLELADGAATVRCTTAAGAERWRCVSSDGLLRLEGEAAASPVTQQAGDLRDAERMLRAEASAHGAEDALAILASEDDGAEVSDVAWPHFVLPQQAYGAFARRVFAAACALWEEAAAPSAAVSAAVVAAVNSAADAGGR